MPFLSVVIPTRDRPAYLQLALDSLSNQTDSDFEIVVADNPVAEPARSVVEPFADLRLDYVPADRPLPMFENWERGIQRATGDYVAVMIDKTAWAPNVVALLKGVVASGADVATWWDAGWAPAMDSVPGFGVATIPHGAAGFAEVDRDALLRTGYSMSVRRGTDFPDYFHGKICFGAYSRELINRILRATGQVCFGLSPDYTSRLAALALADLVVDMAQPLQLSITTSLSNGASSERDPGHALRFVQETMNTDDTRLDMLPVPGVYASTHNLVAYDYARMGDRIHQLRRFQLDRVSLLVRVFEDLENVIWPTDALKEAQLDLANQERERLSSGERSRFDKEQLDSRLVYRHRQARRKATSLLSRSSVLERVVRRFLGGASKGRAQGINEALSDLAQRSRAALQVKP